MKMNSIEAKKFLADQGFFTDNLWHVSDVKMLYNCTENEAYEVLDLALTNANTKSHIWDAIEIAAEHLDLEKL
jgi:hypothetical protein